MKPGPRIRVDCAALAFAAALGWGCLEKVPPPAAVDRGAPADAEGADGRADADPANPTTAIPSPAVDAANAAEDGASNDDLVPSGEVPSAEMPSPPDVPGAPTGTLVAGLIENQTWTLAGSPYLITGDLLVASLLIHAGVVVRARGDYQIEIGGSIHARGEKGKPIVFSTVDAGARWRGIRFVSARGASELVHIVVERSRDSGIAIVDSSPVLRNCHLVSNSAKQGGGLFVSGAGSRPTIANCHIEHNAASDDGGGVYIGTHAAPSFRNTIVAHNQTSDGPRGGGVAICGGHTTLTNVVVAHNGAGDQGGGSGGIALNRADSPGCAGGTLVLANSIVFYNTPFQIQGAGATVKYSNIQGGYAGDETSFNENPIFLPHEIYRLAQSSPCIDRGDPAPAFNDCLPVAVGQWRNDPGAYGGPGGCDW